ncbi:MAG: stress response translation initiation inhibitor YciH [Nitrospirota bacterium]|nr:stress response translation initiation inhibitor YciH [Nitrospirota bacterium]
MPDENSKLVYSTDQPVPKKEKHLNTYSQAEVPPAQLKLLVRLERKSRGGKSVTVIEGLQLPQKEREALLRQLKAKLGTGGAVKDNTLEIQGDHREALIQALEKTGYRPKRSGG